MPKDPNDPPRAHRFEASLPAVLLHDGREYECRAENFSRSGLLLTGSPTWPDAAELTLILRSIAGDLQVPIQVRVVRKLASTDREASLLAVEFAEQDPKKREGIEMLLQRVIEGYGTAADLPAIPAGTPPHQVKKLLDSIPLPHRISLATRGSHAEREILLQDHHPQVLEALARNPGLLPHEARALATSLHLSPPALAALAVDGRWSGDIELKILVVCHSRVSVPLAERMVAELPIPALRRALLKPSLNSFVRAAILQRLSRSAS